MVYENLPVYKAAYDLLLFTFKLNRNFQKEYRYTLGENIKNELVSLLLCIYNANALREKEALLKQAAQHVVAIKIQFRLLADLKQISLKQYANAALQIESISKQLSAWSKSVKS